MTLHYNPAEAVAALSKADKQLAKLIRRVGDFELEPRMGDPFQALLRAIIYQQLSGKAAATIHGRAVKAFGTRGRIKPERLLAAAHDELRSVGMSRAKVAAVRDLAEKTLDGTVPAFAKLRRMSDAEILERLTSVRGIGVWTVEMLLLFRLGRPDVLPVSDLGVRKGFMLTYGHTELPAPKAILAHGERWRPYRSVATWYLWRAVDLHQKTAVPR
ncbi:MAG: DNA-3-methyladenine glycosylase 2 family protein [Planctomycetia bacterium]|nr:DNA-3-methyladenine glycosylase 2 family protein [Planctomycetia bacterium]